MPWRNGDKPNIVGKREQLCWSCAKCISGCSWSRDFIPVEGWDAELDYHRRIDAHTQITYKIYDCPEFAKA